MDSTSLFPIVNKLRRPSHKKNVWKHKGSQSELGEQRIHDEYEIWLADYDKCRIDPIVKNPLLRPELNLRIRPACLLLAHLR